MNCKIAYHNLTNTFLKKNFQNLFLNKILRGLIQSLPGYARGPARTLSAKILSINFRRLYFSSPWINENFHGRIKFIAFSQKVLQLWNFIKKSDCFYFSVITHIERNPENLTFYSPKSNHLGLITATKTSSVLVSVEVENTRRYLGFKVSLILRSKRFVVLNFHGL